ncbi:zinc metalloprotease [Nannocystis pusilla]|uniref:Zinc metalloprotease n=1 Tax=Nannocystis pusilla TaxID=889268 RepID=A0ABS7TZK6_9BACT|nr:zinc metalloprotease [Nannocystis pusilla]MBZ5713591.1 zinc metalloprotease [Nannocystis pusilla]
MKITRYCHVGLCVGVLACEAAQGAAYDEAAADTEVCEAGESEACGGEEFALGPAHDGRCGNHPTSLEVAAMEADISARVTAATHYPEARATIPVYFHVISDDAGSGDISETQITRQLDVLNKAFAGSGFDFSRAGVTRTRKSAWHLMAMDSAAESEAKSALRQGGARTLNVYVVNAVSLLGWATFPWWYSSDPQNDGIVVDRATFPGGHAVNFNSGLTAVHEVGHWLGLYHTFQNGCSFLGDFVGDTPAEQSPATGCPASRDSCKASGSDPIHNYMDYTNDTCRNEFTPGQRSRMSWNYSLFR